MISRRWLSSRRSLARGHDQLGDLRRDEPLERAELLDLGELRRDPLLERPAPRLELGRLLLDGIVQRLDPQDRAHPRDERRMVDRLGDVLVAAGIEPGHDVVGIGLRRDQDDRHERQAGIGLELPADLNAVPARHHDVEQDQIGRLRARGDQRLVAVPGRDHLVTLPRQTGLENLEVRRVVVDDQNARRLPHGCASYPPASGRNLRIVASSWRGLNGLAT